MEINQANPKFQDALLAPMHTTEHILEFVPRDKVPGGIDLSKLPEETGETLRIVKIGDYDACACIGQHVGNTSEIGRFRITSTDFDNHCLRIRFRLEAR